MSFQVRQEQRPATNGLDGTLWILENVRSGAVAEVWPALGFNCVRWAVPCGGQLVEWLYAADNLLSDTRPTRSGIPVLFPFPNRIRNGKFWWHNRVYSLPCNDPTLRNAIHGFACRHPWRVLDSGADEENAWITGEFQASLDAPEALRLWPADHRLRLTLRLLPERLRLEAEVTNPDVHDLPFGLGYHPYFRLPAVPERTWLHVPASKTWVLEDNIPNRNIWNVEDQRDLRSPRRLSNLTFDDIYTDLDGSQMDPDTGLLWRGSVAEDVFELQLHTSPDFGELVVFTPPHRQAVCLEPYTCVTDAINMRDQPGVKVLKPGKAWTGTVELQVVG